MTSFQDEILTKNTFFCFENALCCAALMKIYICYSPFTYTCRKSPFREMKVIEIVKVGNVSAGMINKSAQVQRSKENLSHSFTLLRSYWLIPISI